MVSTGLRQPTLNLPGVTKHRSHVVRDATTGELFCSIYFHHPFAEVAIERLQPQENNIDIDADTGQIRTDIEILRKMCHNT